MTKIIRPAHGAPVGRSLEEGLLAEKEQLRRDLVKALLTIADLRAALHKIGYEADNGLRDIARAALSSPDGGDGK